MRIELEQQLSLSIPVALQSATPVIFESNNKSGDEDEETLTVDHAQVPAGARTVADVLADRVREFEAGLGEKLQIKEERSVSLLGHMGREVEFVFEVENSKMRCWIAVGALTANEYLQITLSLPDRGKGGREFEQIVASASRSGEEMPASRHKGYVRQYAGPITLDVPLNLEPPHAYSFVSADQKTTLHVGLRPARHSAEIAPDLQKEMADDTRYGATIDNQENATLNQAGGHGSIVRYLLTRKEPVGTSVQAVQRGQLSFSDGFVVTFEARSPAASRNELNAHFEEVTRTLERVKP